MERLAEQWNWPWLLARRLLLVAGFLLAGCVSCDPARQNPQTLFQRFVCDPVPASVSGIQASGRLSSSGGSLLIRLKMDPTDFAALLRNGNFHSIPNGTWANVARGHFSECQTECEAPSFFEQEPVRCRRRPGINLVFLMVNPAHDQCWFRYIHPGP